MTDRCSRSRIRWRKLLLLVLLCGFTFLNVIAWVQARAMTHYSSSGQRTAKPEALSLPEKVGAILTGVTVTRPENSHTPADVGLEYEPRRIDIQSGYIDAWFVPHAQSKGLVLMFPGYAESKESLLPSASALHGMGYDLLLVDFRGAGGSSGTETTLGVKEAKDVARSVEYAHVQWPGQPIVLYGVSMGAAPVMRAIAVEGVLVDATVLESPFNSLLSTVRNRFHSMGLPGTPGAELVVFWGSVQQGFNGFEHNPEEYAASVKCPTLVLHGKNDPRVTPHEVRSIYDRLLGRKQLEILEGAGHEALVVYAPDWWDERVEWFLEGVEDH